MAEIVETPTAIATRWSGPRIESMRIEEELARLRYEAAGSPEQGESYALRTSFVNLVIYANDHDTAKHASQVVARMPAQHPSRTIIVVADGDTESTDITTELAAHCHIARGLEARVCCEEVTLTVNGPAADHLHSVLAPLLIPDLPVYVWWIGTIPHDHHLFGELMEHCERFIVDSARFTRTATDLHRLEHLNSRAPDAALGDLNWQRLQPWRQVVHQQCSAPSLEPLIPAMSSIKITLARSDGEQHWSQALLMAGWLASTFGLDTNTGRMAGNGNIKIQTDEHNALIRIVPTESPGIPPGDVVSVELRCGASDSKASLDVSRKSDPHLLRITVHEPGGGFESHVHIEPGDESAMLGRELDSLAHDPEYHDVLRATLPLVASVT